MNTRRGGRGDVVYRTFARARIWAQDLANLGGKVLRLRPDGGVPADNPFSGSYVWSYGHRNPQGLAFDSAGRLWEQEFGNNVKDETNIIVKELRLARLRRHSGRLQRVGAGRAGPHLPGRAGLVQRDHHRPGRALHRLPTR